MNRLRSAAGAVAACAPLVAAAPAGAQAPAVQQLPTLTVTAPAILPPLTVPTVEDARDAIERIPGAVELVPAEDFRQSRALTVKDMLGYVPGVLAQPKFAEDSRLSIRGSGLSRNFHLRGVRLLQDGVPLNTADGSADFQEIDPLTLRYVEVFKGANALRYGATALGGAINFVTPTGRDADPFLVRGELGSFDFRRFQVSAGGMAGDWDYYVTPTLVQQDGFREHSEQDNRRLTGNLGYRIANWVETRFYFTYNDINQEIPGAVSRSQALSDPEDAFPRNVVNDFRRDIESVRFANKTSFLFDDLALDVGAYVLDRQLDHPIFQVLDNHFVDYGGFVRGAGEWRVVDHRNQFVAGANLNAGTNDNRRFVNVGGSKGALTTDMKEKAFNIDVYAENRFFATPNLALVLGAQFGHSTRRTDDRFLADGDDSASRSYTFFNPKLGFVWDVEPEWQVFGNVSRSTEVPTFAELNPTAQPGFADLKAQKAVTAELGTRGRRDGYVWDAALYRSWIKDELQLFDLGGGATFARNADRTIHQGIEIGFGAAIFSNLFVDGQRADRLWFRQAYTFSDFRFDDDPQFGDNELPGAPRHYFRAELLYEHPSGFYFGPNVEWVPEAYYVDNANSLKTRAYALLGFRAGYEFGRGSVFLDARNLTDEKYISSVSVTPVAAPGQPLFDPGSGAAAYVGLQIHW